MGDLLHPNIFQGFCLGGVSEWQWRSLPHLRGRQRAEVTLGYIKGSVQGGEPVGKSLKGFLKDVAENRRKKSGHLSSEQGGCRRQEAVGMQQQSSGGWYQAMAAVVPGQPGKGALLSPGNALQEGGGSKAACKGRKHYALPATRSGSAPVPSPHSHRSGYRCQEVRIGEIQEHL